MRTCKWTGGCEATLSIYNTSDLCNPHQRAKALNEVDALSPRVEMKIHAQKQKFLGTPEKLCAEDICEIVAQAYDISMNDLLGNRRLPNIVMARRTAAYLLRVELQFSDTLIGFELDITQPAARKTREKAEAMIATDPLYKNEIDAIRALCKGGIPESPKRT